VADARASKACRIGFSRLHSMLEPARPTRCSLIGEAQTIEDMEDSPSKTLRSGDMMGRNQTRWDVCRGGWTAEVTLTGGREHLYLRASRPPTRVFSHSIEHEGHRIPGRSRARLRAASR
jgi:hypothetical protein